MRLAEKSRAHLEEFLREHLGDEFLRLPALIIYCGKFAGLITKLVGVGAITLGRFVLVSPRLIARDGRGRIVVPGWLMAHEAMHVVQYRRAGVVGFLTEYFGEFWRLLREGKSLDAAARMRAYLALPEECDARAAESAYMAWLVHPSGAGAAADVGGDDAPRPT